MRTIKFRGKRLDNGKWIEGCFAEFVHPIDGDTKPGIQVTRCVPSLIDRFMPVYETELVEVLPESVGQWTGLVDRHGKEIFEGDVVGFEDAIQTEGGAYEQNCIGAVEWGEETASFEITNRLSAESWEVLCECAVIGSLIDSPELMEVE